MNQTTTVSDRDETSARVPTGPERRVWLLLVDPLPNRIFFDCGIVDALRRELDDALAAVWLVNEKHIRPWLDRSRGMPMLTKDDLMPVSVVFRERVLIKLASPESPPESGKAEQPAAATPEESKPAAVPEKAPEPEKKEPEKQEPGKTG